ncbi:MAG: sigma-70 family RNA polymerase sigma factor [Granulosicoccus sp.]
MIIQATQVIERREAFIDTDDEQLMLEYSSGEVQAFKQLYSRYEQSVYRFAFNGCNNEARASELFQEIWLRVIKARKSFKPSQPFKAWLFTIARNLLIDNYRSQSRTALDNRAGNDAYADPDTLPQDSFSSIPDTWSRAPLTPEQIACASEQNTILRDALQSLPLAQREAVMLKHIAGLSISEIAQMQGQGSQAVKSRLRYAMVKLRQNLKELS